MNELTSKESLESVAAFLPMIYMAWADGDLDDEEIRAVRSAAKPAASPGGESVQLLLDRWLDPDAPPNAFELALLLDAIEEGVKRCDLEVDARLDLAGLGLAIAQVSGGSDGTDSADRRDAADVTGGIDSAEHAALVAMQEALGVDSGEAARQLLATGRPGAERFSSESTFAVEDLARYLDEPEPEMRQKVRDLLVSQEFRYLAEPTRSEHRQAVFEWVVRLAQEGFGALSYPEEYGGGGSTAKFMAAFETLALGDLSLQIKFGVQFGLFGGSILQLGTSKHHAKYLDDVGTLALPGCFAMTETGHGSNVADIETVATFDPQTDTFEVHTPHPGAMKNYIGNAALHGRMATVFVQLEVGGKAYGVHAIMVPIRDTQGQTLPGITIEDDGLKLGLNGIDNGRIAFDSVRVPRDNLLDRFAQVSSEGAYSSPIASPSARFFTMLGTLVGGRVSVAASGNTAAKSALTIAVRYANRRRQFGPPGVAEFTLLDYLSHQERLLPRLAKTYAAHFALRDLGRSYVAVMEGAQQEASEEGSSEQEGREERDTDGRRALEGQAAALKAFATWHGTDTVQACREACGGQGYLAENRFAALKADSDIFTTFEGDNTVLLQLVAKGLLSEYQKQFHDMNFRRVVRYAAKRVGGQLRELVPSLPKSTDPESLRSREFQQELFAFREEHLLESLALRLKKRLDSGQDSSRAVLEVQDHMIELALAHADRLALQSFCAGIDGAPDDAREILENLRALFGLSTLEQDRGWFLEHGGLEPRASKAIRGEVNRLLGELRGEAEHLVMAWGIPKELVAAPIAF